MEMLRSFVQALKEKQDPRTRDYPVLTHPLFVFGAIVGYVYVARNGERWMKNRQPFEVTLPIRIYNIFMVIANLAFVYVGLTCIILQEDFSLFCEGIHGR